MCAKRIHTVFPALPTILLSLLFLLLVAPIVHAQNNINKAGGVSFQSDSCAQYTTCESCVYPNDGCAWCTTDNSCTSAWYNCDTSALIAYTQTCPASTTAETTYWSSVTTFNSSSTTTINSTSSINYTTIINSTSSINYTTTVNSACPPGEVLGGLPSGPICYEPGTYAAESGDASVVDLSGNPVSNFASGTAVVTGSNGSVLQVDPGFVMRVGPDSSASILNVVGDPSSGYSLSQESESFISEDQQGQIMLKSIREAFDSAKEIYKSHTPFSTAMATLKAMMNIKKGILEIEENDFRNIQYVVTQSASITPSGDPSFAINASNAGTDVGVTNGTVLVISLASNSTLKYVILQAGQELFVPNNRTMANQEDLNASIRLLLQDGLTNTFTWQSSSSRGSVTGTIIIIFIVIIAVAWLLLRGRGKKNRPEAANEAKPDGNSKEPPRQRSSRKN